MPADLDALEALLRDIPEDERWGRYWTVDTARRHIADAAPALIAELRELREANRWRPIAEAPRDGTKVDVWLEDGGRFSDCRYVNGNWCQWGFDLFQSQVWIAIGFTPTHFRPLPDPPEGA